MMKTRIGLAVLALSLSACTAAVAQRGGDVSGQALPRAPRALAGWELSDCDAKSRAFRTRSDITLGGDGHEHCRHGTGHGEQVVLALPRGTPPPGAMTRSPVDRVNRRAGISRGRVVLTESEGMRKRGR